MGALPNDPPLNAPLGPCIICSATIRRCLANYWVTKLKIALALSPPQSLDTSLMPIKDVFVPKYDNDAN